MSAVVLNPPVGSGHVIKSVNDLIEDGISRLGPFREGVARRRLRRNPERLEEARELILVKLTTDEPAVAMLGPDTVRAICNGTINASTPLGIDPAKIDEILELIFKWLPKIFELIKLFA